MAIIQLNNLSKTYHSEGNPVVAVENVSLTVNEAEFIAIVGSSGSGKTTLLNLIGGLDKPTSGKVFIEDTDITKLSSSKLIKFRLFNIGFVFQSYNLVPVLTVRENIELIMQLQGVGNKKRDARTTELLNAIGLLDRGNSRPAKLSGGQQQRVAVARAMASKPKFILADEPTANLDSKTAGTLLDMMLELNATEKITFIFSTHDPRVVQKARRVVSMEDGHIINDQVM
jgi:putative ABC transport system ATP-binding protein